MTTTQFVKLCDACALRYGYGDAEACPAYPGGLPDDIADGADHRRLRGDEVEPVAFTMVSEDLFRAWLRQRRDAREGVKHLGPGPHPSGSPQTVHAGLPEVDLEMFHVSLTGDAPGQHTGGWVHVGDLGAARDRQDQVTRVLLGGADDERTALERHVLHDRPFDPKLHRLRVKGPALNDPVEMSFSAGERQDDRIAIPDEAANLFTTDRMTWVPVGEALERGWERDERDIGTGWFDGYVRVPMTEEEWLEAGEKLVERYEQKPQWDYQRRYAPSMRGVWERVKRGERGVIFYENSGERTSNVSAVVPSKFIEVLETKAIEVDEVKHGGPGPHSTGSPQAVHAGGAGSAPRPLGWLRDASHEFASGIAGVDLPPLPGTVSPPDDGRSVRLYHYTRGEDELRSILDDGLRIDRARGERYGEPNLVWASTSKPSDDRHYVEFFADPYDAVVGDPYSTDPERFDPREFESRGSNLAFAGDIDPERIVTFNEPWHHTARYLRDNYTDDDLDAIVDDGDPEIAPALERERARRAMTSEIDLDALEADDWGDGPEWHVADFGMKVGHAVDFQTASRRTVTEVEAEIAPDRTLHTPQHAVFAEKVRQRLNDDRDDGPVELVADASGRLWVGDGHHRIAAARVRGQSFRAVIRAPEPQGAAPEIGFARDGKRPKPSTHPDFMQVYRAASDTSWLLDYNEFFTIHPRQRSELARRVEVGYQTGTVTGMKRALEKAEDDGVITMDRSSTTFAYAWTHRLDDLMGHRYVVDGDPVPAPEPNPDPEPAPKPERWFESSITKGYMTTRAYPHFASVWELGDSNTFVSITPVDYETASRADMLYDDGKRRIPELDPLRYEADVGSAEEGRALADRWFAKFDDPDAWFPDPRWAVTHGDRDARTWTERLEHQGPEETRPRLDVSIHEDTMTVAVRLSDNASPIKFIGPADETEPVARRWAEALTGLTPVPEASPNGPGWRVKSQGDVHAVYRMEDGKRVEAIRIGRQEWGGGDMPRDVSFLVNDTKRSPWRRAAFDVSDFDGDEDRALRAAIAYAETISELSGYELDRSPRVSEVEVDRDSSEWQAARAMLDHDLGTFGFPKNLSKRARARIADIGVAYRDDWPSMRIAFQELKESGEVRTLALPPRRAVTNAMHALLNGTPSAEISDAVSAARLGSLARWRDAITLDLTNADGPAGRAAVIRRYVETGFVSGDPTELANELEEMIRLRVPDENVTRLALMRAREGKEVSDFRSPNLATRRELAVILARMEESVADEERFAQRRGELRHLLSTANLGVTEDELFDAYASLPAKRASDRVTYDPTNDEHRARLDQFRSSAHGMPFGVDEVAVLTGLEVPPIVASALISGRDNPAELPDDTRNVAKAAIDIVAAQHARLAADYPSAAAVLQSVDDTYDNRAYMAYSAWTRTIHFTSRGRWRDDESLRRQQNWVRRDVRTGWHPPHTGSVEAIYTHEFGHHLHDRMTTRSVSRLNRAVAEYVRMRNENPDADWREALARADAIVGEVDTQSRPRDRFWRSGAVPAARADQMVKSGLSRYALKNGQEFVAEAFAEYRHSPDPRPLARIVGTIIDDEFKGV